MLHFIDVFLFRHFGMQPPRFAMRYTLGIKYRRIRVLVPIGKQKQYAELPLTVIYGAAFYGSVGIGEVGGRTWISTVAPSRLSAYAVR